MGNGAKIGLVGVLAMIVLVVAVWDRTNEEKHKQAVKELPPLPLEAERPRERVRVAPEPAAENRVTGEMTNGPLLASAPGPRAPGRGARPQGGDSALHAETAPATRGTTVVEAVPVPAAPARKTYTIAGSDTLSRIAAKFYGSKKHWKKIAEANKGVIENPDRLPVGKEIVIPPLETALAREAPGATTVRPALSAVSEVTSVRSGTGTGTGTGKKTYTVERGDTLGKIAEKLLGSKGRWSEILEANRDKLKTEQSLRAGQQLVIPAGR